MVDLNRFKSTPRPWVLVFGWPEPVGANQETIRAVNFVGEDAKNGFDAMLVRDDGRFIGLRKLRKSWSVFSGDFIGEGSIIDSEVVRADSTGRAIAPRNRLASIFAGRGSSECTGPEAIAITLDFNNYGGLPPGFAWWQGKSKS